MVKELMRGEKGNKEQNISKMKFGRTQLARREQANELTSQPTYENKNKHTNKHIHTQ